MNVLAAKNVTYIYQSKYQKVQALTDVTCDFEEGKFYAIVGHSGSGKTTLLSLLAGLGEPTKGEILVNGKSVKEIGSQRHRRENVSVIYQAFNLFPTLNILENVMYPMQISLPPLRLPKERSVISASTSLQTPERSRWKRESLTLQTCVTGHAAAIRKSPTSSPPCLISAQRAITTTFS